METHLELPIDIARKRKKHKKISDLIIFVFFLANIFKYFEVISSIMADTFLVFIGFIAIVHVFLHKGISKQRNFIIFIFIYTFCGMFGIIINGNMDIQELVWPIAFMGIGLLMLNFAISYRLTKIIYYLYNILMIYSIVIVGNVDLLNAVSSRNTISVGALNYFCLYAITAYNQNEKITVMPVLLGLLTSFMAVGRSGILTFTILLIFIAIQSSFNNKSKIINIFKSILIIATIVISVNLLYNLFGNYFEASIINFQEKGTESTRTYIWADYLKKAFTSITNFLFGAPIGGTYYLDQYRQNLHNSFLMLHAKYGIIPLYMVIILIVNSIMYFIKNKNYLFVYLCITILFRMQFDYTNFNAQLDSILIYFLFYPFYKTRKIVK